VVPLILANGKNQFPVGIKIKFNLFKTIFKNNKKLLIAFPNNPRNIREKNNNF
jgi:hypothetical protein